MAVQDIKEKDVEVLGEVLGVVVSVTVNGVPANVCIGEFIVGVTVVSDLGGEDHPEGVCIVRGVDIVSNGFS